jgi:type II secretory ATPase GspE/PulE/Tfp pilus assembly ATPase PilB-like protein
MNTDIDTRINEAEVCRSMGLFSESLYIYEKILVSIPSEATHIRKKIITQMDLLKEEIAKEEVNAVSGMSESGISWLRKTISGSGDASAILDSAAAFQEMGLYAESVSEYAKLLSKDVPLPEKIIPGLAEGLLKLHPASHVPVELDALILKAGLDKAKASRIKLMMGMEMEKRDQHHQAYDFFAAALELMPEDAEIRKRFDSVAAAFSSGSKYDYLLREKMVTTDQLQKAFGLSKRNGQSVEQVLIENFKVQKEMIGKSFSLFYGCKFRAFDPGVPTPFELLVNLKKPFLLNELWVPISWSKDGIDVLVDDPRDLGKTDNIKALLKTAKINVAVAIREDIQAFINHFFEKERTAETLVQQEATTDDIDIPNIRFEEESDELTDEEVDVGSSQVVRLVDQVIIAAYRKNASDIHIEPSTVTKATAIRFRLDGVCQEYMKIPNGLVRAVVSRIKIMSNLDIAERRLPQDGKIKFRRKGVPPFEMRVATLPTAGGFEDVVLRILASSGAMKIDEMGLSERNLKIIKKIVQTPYGLILAVGPTGSGKTTTLHALLGFINKPGVKIWTAEDPIEITQAGLRQVEVKPKIGLDFARVMRAFLRADPDVIMIGEMRDEETAAIGIEASLTGHLVFSTLHTNSAPETVTRLLDMGLNALNFSDAFLGVLAQRLTRRLCTSCRKEYALSRDEFEELRLEYGAEWFGRTGVNSLETLRLFKPHGCENCSNTGYRGRMGIHELMEGTPEIKLMIKKQANTEELLKTSMQQGMATLKQDGIFKMLRGMTDISEVRRVCIN